MVFHVQHHTEYDFHTKYTTSSFFLSKMTFFDMLSSEVIKKAVF